MEQETKIVPSDEVLSVLVASSFIFVFLSQNS